VRDLKPAVPDAPKILLHNVYGWFDRVERGVYTLTDAGRAALKRWPQPAVELPSIDRDTVNEATRGQLESA
jgi:hypothetical protein